MAFGTDLTRPATAGEIEGEMSKAKHTPLYHHKTDGGAEYLCTEHIAGCNEGDLHHAAVRLDGGPELSPFYAAAPELLEACRTASNRLAAEGLCVDDDIWPILDQAIAKAEAEFRSSHR